MRGTPFNETHKSTHVEPACGQTGAHEDFYERIYEGEGTQDEVFEIDPKNYADMGKFLNEFLKWIVSVNLDDQRSLKTIGIRALAAAWVINPKLFDSRSVTNIALQLGFRPFNITRFSAEFSRKFKIKNEFQSHDWRCHEEETKGGSNGVST